MTSDIHDYRAQRVREVLRGDGLPSAMVVTDPANIYWLTGLASSHALVVVLPRRVVLITDNRYAERAHRSSSAVEVLINRDLFAGAAAVVGVDGAGQVVVEVDDISVASHSRLAQLLVGSRLVDSRGICEQLRAAKDADEVVALATACQISTQALNALVEYVVPGMTEIVIARHLEQLFGELGAEDRAFASIVASGPNSAIPHHEPTTREVGVGDVLKIDFGARVDGYHADCTRTFIVGGVPSPKLRDVHAAVEAAASAARAALQVGVQVAELDSIARSILRDAGFESYFTHGLGHGVGLRIHEAPLLAQGSAGTIADGSVVTIEPGVYLPGEFGVRIEDTCHVTADAVTILTDFPRNLARIA